MVRSIPCEYPRARGRDGPATAACSVRRGTPPRTGERPWPLTPWFTRINRVKTGANPANAFALRFNAVKEPRGASITPRACVSVANEGRRVIIHRRRVRRVVGVRSPAMTSSAVRQRPRSTRVDPRETGTTRRPATPLAAAKRRNPQGSPLSVSLHASAWREHQPAIPRQKPLSTSWWRGVATRQGRRGEAVTVRIASSFPERLGTPGPACVASPKYHRRTPLGLRPNALPPGAGAFPRGAVWPRDFFDARLPALRDCTGETGRRVVLPLGFALGP